MSVQKFTFLLIASYEICRAHPHIWWGNLLVPELGSNIHGSRFPVSDPKPHESIAPLAWYIFLKKLKLNFKNLTWHVWLHFEVLAQKSDIWHLLKMYCSDDVVEVVIAHLMHGPVCCLVKRAICLSSQRHHNLFCWKSKKKKNRTIINNYLTVEFDEFDSTILFFQSIFNFFNAFSIFLKKWIWFWNSLLEYDRGDIRHFTLICHDWNIINIRLEYFFFQKTNLFDVKLFAKLHDFWRNSSTICKNIKFASKFWMFIISNLFWNLKFWIFRKNTLKKK